MMTERKEPYNKREEILEIASQLFYEQGFHCTGIQQIITESGIAKGTFYGHFKSKETLGLAWLEKRHETWMHKFETYIGEKQDTRAKILGMFEFLGDWMEEANYRGCVFLNTLCETPDFENPFRSVIESHKNELLNRMIELIHSHHADKNPDTCEQLGKLLFILFEGTLIQLQNFRDRWPLEAALAEVEKQI